MKFINQIDRSSYHYIIGGAGLAGLTLALKLKENGLLENKRLLIIDPDKKDKNDRTWSFWAKDITTISSIPQFKQWGKAKVKSKNLNKEESLTPYQYYSIEGIDYYNYIKEQLRNHQIDWLVSPIISDDPDSKKVSTQAGEITYEDYFFSSQFINSEIKERLENFKHSFLWQHFLGYTIEVEQATFDPDSITYMDMQIEQVKYGLAFIYILPYSNKKALIEYTLFSKDLLKKEDYQEILEKYIKSYLKNKKYSIISTEFNKIPMTTGLKESVYKRRIPIGTKSGTVKASTGYSFLRVQKQVDKIIYQLKTDKPIRPSVISKRHLFYDAVLLDVLETQALTGSSVFEKLYKGNSFKNLLKFLDEETNIMEEMNIMLSVPKWTFTKSALKLLFS